MNTNKESAVSAPDACGGTPAGNICYPLLFTKAVFPIDETPTPLPKIPFFGRASSCLFNAVTITVIECADMRGGILSNNMIALI